MCVAVLSAATEEQRRKDGLRDRFSGKEKVSQMGGVISFKMRLW